VKHAARRPLLVIGLLAAPFAFAFATEAPDASPAGVAMEKLRRLAGEWEGPVEWTGARTDRGTMHASYFVTGRGSAVVETLSSPGGEPTMSSVYHRDGGDLRVTHFCGAQNQPRLKAAHLDPGHGSLDFEYVDATNLASPDAPHVTGLEVRFLGPDRVDLVFRFEAGAKVSRERIELSRAAAAR
jgi:hypothetical protein